MSKRFQRCYLHIGTEKTGTTTIQSFLSVNAERLLDQGVLYPTTFRGPRDNQFKLAVYGQNDQKIDDLRRGIGIVEASEIARFRKKLEQRFADEVIQTDASVLLLSNEHCHSRLTSKDEVERIAGLLAPWCEEFRIIAYLRPQHELAVSRYSTHIKLGGRPGNPFPDVDRKSSYYNYHRLLKRWADVFGENSICPVVFSRGELIEQDLLSDFLSRTGVNGRDLTRVESKNESLSPQALDFLGKLNPYLPQFEDGKPTGYRRNIGSVMEDLFPGKGPMPTRGEAMEFYSRFDIPNRNVCRRFFPNKKTLFNPDFSKFPDNSGPTGESLSMADAFKMFAELWKRGNV